MFSHPPSAAKAFLVVLICYTRCVHPFTRVFCNKNYLLHRNMTRSAHICVCALSSLKLSLMSHMSVKKRLLGMKSSSKRMYTMRTTHLARLEQVQMFLRYSTMPLNIAPSRHCTIFLAKIAYGAMLRGTVEYRKNDSTCSNRAGCIVCVAFVRLELDFMPKSLVFTDIWVIKLSFRDDITHMQI